MVNVGDGTVSRVLKEYNVKQYAILIE